MIGNDLNSKIPNSYEDQVFAFSTEVFQFSKFHKNEVKHDKGNFKRWLTVMFEGKKLQNVWKNWPKILQCYFVMDK